MSAIPTVKIVSGAKAGYTTINESDFDESVHRLYGSNEPEPEPELNIEPTLLSVFGDQLAGSLAEGGFDTVEDVAYAELGDVTGVAGMDLEQAQNVVVTAQRALE